MGPLRGKAGDLPGQRRAEKKRLTLGFRRCAVDDLADIRNKPHVEHPVGLIDDQHFDLFQVDVAAPLEVEQSSRRGNDDIDRTGVQLLSLLFIIHAAEHGNDFQITVLGEITGFRGNLKRQFTGGGEDQDPGRPRFSLFGVGIGQDPGDDGNQESRCLTRTGLGAPRGILPARLLGRISAWMGVQY